MVQTKRRRWRSISVEGTVPAMPPAAAAFEVPTAGVPTYFVASTAGLAAGFAASGFGLTLLVSNSAMRPSCDCLRLTLISGGSRVLRRRYLPPDRTDRYDGRNFLLQRLAHDLRESLNEFRRIIEAGAHFKLCDAEFVRFVASLVIDFGERLNVIGDERHGHHAELAFLLGCERS